MIPVESIDSGPGYDTAEEAIAAAKAHPLQSKARADGARFAGRGFVDAWRDDGQWVLEFSNGLWLRVFNDGRHVLWAVEESRPDVTAVEGPQILVWPSGAVSRTDAAVVARDRRGAEFWQFFVTELGFHVYLRRKLILCFSPVCRRDTGEPLLHVWEDD
ncbi:MAG TPA: hypothetical protein VFB66_17590 [Tepidisphaeraceae bacterium]|nr:hypothetical protein [Tepidisphaeraceae bacterium]